MKSRSTLLAAVLICQLSPGTSSAFSIDLAMAGPRVAGTPFYFNLPDLPSAGAISVEFVVGGASAFIELFEHTNFALHVNDPGVKGNSVLYSFVFANGNQEKMLGADDESVELGAFDSGLPQAPPHPGMDDIDPSQLAEERFFQGIHFDLPELPNLDSLPNGFNAAIVFDRDVAVGLLPPSVTVPEPTHFLALASLLAMSGTVIFRNRMARPRATLWAARE